MEPLNYIYTVIRHLNIGDPLTCYHGIHEDVAKKVFDDACKYSLAGHRVEFTRQAVMPVEVVSSFTKE